MTSDTESVAGETRNVHLAPRRWALAVAVLAILFSGVMHGLLDGRWDDQDDLTRVGARISEIPKRIGDWELIADQGLSDQEQQILQCYGSFARTYANPATGEQVTALLLYGPRGPMAVHRPEICYGGGGYSISTPRVAETVRVDGQENQLWKVQLKQSHEADASMEVWYGFSDGGNWNAAKYPRVWLTDQLYKVQVSGRPATGGGQSPVQQFVEELLPIVKERALRDS